MVDGSYRIYRFGPHREQSRVGARIYLFVQNVLIDGAQKLEDYLDADMIQHNPDLQDGVAGLRSDLERVPTRHGKIHRVLAEGNSVLATRSG